jgi:HD superfamily phosphodiesterase
MWLRLRIAHQHAGKSGGRVPSWIEAEALSCRLLADLGTRWPHVRTAGHVADGLAALFSPQEHELLVAAATLHDIGYSPAVARTGFHPLDGGLYLREQGYSERLASLVANHSYAALTAPAHGIENLGQLFPREDSLLADALAYSDMHSGPEGQVIEVEDRLADIAQRHGAAEVQCRVELLRESVARVTNELARTASCEPRVSA